MLFHLLLKIPSPAATSFPIWKQLFYLFCSFSERYTEQSTKPFTEGHEAQRCILCVALVGKRMDHPLAVWFVSLSKSLRISDYFFIREIDHSKDIGDILWVKSVNVMVENVLFIKINCRMSSPFGLFCFAMPWLRRPSKNLRSSALVSLFLLLC